MAFVNILLALNKYVVNRSVQRIKSDLCLTLGLRREVDENRAPLGYYVASNGNSLLTFLDNLSVGL
jgi:hypothetical protein